MSNILSILILLPLFGALSLYIFCKNEDGQNLKAKITSLWFSIIELCFVIALYLEFDHNISEMQFIELYPLIPSLNVNFALGVDGLSINFILLTAILIPICILCGWNSVNNRVLEYVTVFLVVESLIIGSFSATDFLVFYMFFEAILIPMYIIIGVWGAEERILAAFKFFLYTLAGSLLFLLAIIYIYNQTGTFDIIALQKLVPIFDYRVQLYLWIAFFASFAIKVPMCPFHTWLPYAHVEAPTGGSVLLAGILLKLGGYGFLRFSLPMLPSACIEMQWLIFLLSGIAVVYASIVALGQSNMKKLIAYSSVAHMGFVTIGIFSFNEQGINGAIFQMISHGLVSSALFLMVGFLYNQMHTKEISNYGGVAFKLPFFAALSLFFTMASIGLPGTSGFVGESLVLLGTFQASHIYSFICGLGLILGAAYSLWLYKRVFFGQISNQAISKLVDVKLIDGIYFVILLLLILFIGIYPISVFDSTEEFVSKLIEHFSFYGKL